MARAEFNLRQYREGAGCSRRFFGGSIEPRILLPANRPASPSEFGGSPPRACCPAGEESYLQPTSYFAARLIGAMSARRERRLAEKRRKGAS
jgi:hypothetical protein